LFQAQQQQHKAPPKRLKSNTHTNLSRALAETESFDFSFDQLECRIPVNQVQRGESTNLVKGLSHSSLLAAASKQLD